MDVLIVTTVLPQRHQWMQDDVITGQNNQTQPKNTIKKAPSKSTAPRPLHLGES